LAQEQFECSGGPFEIFTERSEFRCERRELREQSRGAGGTAGFRGFRNAYSRQRIERLHAAPGTSPADTLDAAILRVRMQRSSLGALGLPVNEERAGEWIQVDLLVGNDGLPQAVRLPQE